MCKKENEGVMAEEKNEGDMTSRQSETHVIESGLEEVHRLLELKERGFERLETAQILDIDEGDSVWDEESDEEPKERVTETYWPKLKELIKKDPDVVHRLDLDCPICFERMTIKRYEHDFKKLTSSGRRVSHRASISPCGHMFGDSCIYKMLNSDQNSDKKSACPICRLSLKHEFCSHAIEGAAMPHRWEADDQLQDMEKLPLTVSEGGKLSSSCIECLLARSLSGLRNTAHLLLDQQEYPDTEELRLDVYALGNGLEYHYIDEPDSDSRCYVEEFWEAREILQDLCDRYADTLKRESLNRWCKFQSQTLTFKIALYRPRTTLIRSYTPGTL